MMTNGCFGLLWEDCDNLGLVFVCSFCLAVGVHWGGPGLANLQIGVCLTLFSGNTLCRPRHAPLFGIRGKKTKSLVPSLLALSAHIMVAFSIFKKLLQDQIIGAIWQIPLFANDRQLACLELMSNASLLQAGYKPRGTAGHE